MMNIGDATTCSLYYKHMTIINYASSNVNKLEALLTDDARVIIYDRHVFIVQAIGVCHSDDSRGVIYDRNIFIIQARLAFNITPFNNTG
jgi:hypothetical protein